MKRKTQNIIVYAGIALAVVVLLVGVFVYLKSSGKTFLGLNRPYGLQWDNPDPTGLPSDVENWQKLSLPEYGVALKYPQNFTLGRFYDSTGEFIIIQNAQKHQGLQVYIRPAPEEINMTAERIRQDIPDLKINPIQTIPFINQSTGQQYRQGLLFESNNKAFDGDAVEAWFTYNQNLFQITTYSSLRPFLENVLKTWEFNS